MGGLERMVIERFVSPGMHVVDVGANIGLYTFYFSQRVGAAGKVTALEPAPELRQALAKSLEKNRINNVEILPYAAGATESSMLLSLDPLNSGNNWVTPDEPKNRQVKISVPLRRLDALELRPAPDFVKIDVQGWEVQVLQGMSGWIERNIKPPLFCEVSEAALQAAHASTEALAKTLLGYGYEIYLPRKERAKLELHPMTTLSLKEHASKNLYFDVIALAAR
jgi:FkbM family methyltransferase